MRVLFAPAVSFFTALSLISGCGGASSNATIGASGENLKKISRALQQFEYDLNALPARFMPTKDGKPGLSWRVELLPHLGEEALYREFHLDEPWDSPHNKALIEKIPAVYRSPRGKAAEGRTNYLAIAGANSAIAEGRRRPSYSCTDGTANTVMVIEAGDESAVEWTKPDDFLWKADAPAAGLGFGGDDPILLILVDGSVQRLPANVPTTTLAALYTPNGKEVVDVSEWFAPTPPPQRDVRGSRPDFDAPKKK